MADSLKTLGLLAIAIVSIWVVLSDSPEPVNPASSIAGNHYLATDACKYVVKQQSKHPEFLSFATSEVLPPDGAEYQVKLTGSARSALGLDAPFIAVCLVTPATYLARVVLLE